LTTLSRLNETAECLGIRTESGKAVRFVPPGTRDAYYEVRVFESGHVETRPDSLHDWFNALAWLAFPKTKARINAMHAAEIPREGARRGRLRDMLTLFDEGGAIVQCPEDLKEMILSFSWQELFWRNRERVRAEARFLVLGHAVLEKALEPWPGLTCKVLFAREDSDAAVILSGCKTPQDLAPLPVFGYPGWLAQDEAFYDDTRYFRERRT
jgi:hypothetical protein